MTNTKPQRTHTTANLVASGSWVEGQRVEFTVDLVCIRNGKFHRRGVTKGGVYSGTYVDEYGETYALFKDGHINGIPQTAWGSPLADLSENWDTV